MKEDHDHPHRYHSRHEKHEHTHGVVDPSLFATERGIWAVKWSFAGLFMTALFQAVIVLYSGSIALLVDTVQNFRKRSRKKRSATRGNR